MAQLDAQNPGMVAFQLIPNGIHTFVQPGFVNANGWQQHLLECMFLAQSNEMNEHVNDLATIEPYDYQI
jgi:hypothetical protein